jgi:hypothetical protein
LQNRSLSEEMAQKAVAVLSEAVEEAEENKNDA